MEIEVDRKAFASALASVQKITAKRVSFATTSCVLLSTMEGHVRIEANDLTLASTCWREANVKRAGKVAVPSRELYEIVRAMPGDRVLLTVGAGKVLLQSGKRRFELACLDAGEYPAFPAPDAKAQQIKLTAGVIRRLLHRTHYAASHDETRPHLNGVMLEVRPDNVRVVATDGHRLALADAAHSSKTKLNVLVPERCVAELETALATVPHDDVVDLTVSAKTIHVTTGGNVLACKLGEYVFPAYDRVIPTEEGRVVEVDRQALAESLAAVRVAADSTAQVLFALDRGVLRLRARSDGEKAGEDELDASYEGERFEVALNAAYVLDVLRALGGKRVRMHVLSDRDPVRIVDPDDTSAVAIVMPMRR